MPPAKERYFDFSPSDFYPLWFFLLFMHLILGTKQLAFRGEAPLICCSLLDLTQCGGNESL